MILWVMLSNHITLVGSNEERIPKGKLNFRSVVGRRSVGSASGETSGARLLNTWEYRF